MIYPNTRHEMIVPTKANVNIAPKLRKKNLWKK